MVEPTMDPVVWLRKQLEEADVDLLREMVATFVQWAGCSGTRPWPQRSWTGLLHHAVVISINGPVVPAEGEGGEGREVVPAEDLSTRSDRHVSSFTFGHHYSIGDRPF